MLNVILYSKQESPFDSYQLEPNSQMNSVVLTANPAKSDHAREHLISLGLAEFMQSSTISKFTQDFLKVAGLEGKLSKKAEIVEALCFGWMRSHGEKDFNRFLTAYNIFSELRGFSTDLTLMGEVLEFFDQDLAQGVSSLWRLYDLLGNFVDEHQAYQLMSQLMSTEVAEKILENFPPRLIFWGFDHLSGTQVDLIKNLAHQFEIDVLYPKAEYQLKKSSDWISWLGKDQEIDLESTSLPEITVYTYPRMRLAELDYNFEKHSLVFATTKLSADLILQVPSSSQQFSYNINPFDSALNKVRDELLQKEGERVEQVLAFLDQRILEMKSLKHFKEIKVASLYKEFFAGIFWPSSHSKKMSIFLVELAHYVVGLNKPRVSLLPFTKEINELKILDAKDYLDLNKQEVVMVALAEHSSLRSSPALISKEAEKKLMVIGPLYNKARFYQAFKIKLQRDLAEARVHLFLEEGVLEKEAAWEEILSDFPKVEKIKIGRKKAKEEKLLLQESFHQSDATNKDELPLSYSAFQSYYECPRKFALQFLEKRSPMALLDHTLGSSQLGELEHAVIENYFKGVSKETMNLAFVPEKHELLVRQMMAEFISLKSLSLSTEDYHQAFYEILSLSETGIMFLLEMMKSETFVKVIFEQSFKSSKLKGRIDAVLSYDWGDLVVDFKRSAGSIPTMAQILTYEKVQMPLYLNHGKLTAKGFAYINLSEISDSLFILENSALESLKSLALSMKLRDFSLGPWLNEYQVLEEKILGEYEQEEKFKARPRSPLVCNYCLLNNVCTRSYV